MVSTACICTLINNYRNCISRFQEVQDFHVIFIYFFISGLFQMMKMIFNMSNNSFYACINSNKKSYLRD